MFSIVYFFMFYLNPFVKNAFNLIARLVRNACFMNFRLGTLIVIFFAIELFNKSSGTVC